MAHPSGFSYRSAAVGPCITAWPSRRRVKSGFPRMGLTLLGPYASPDRSHAACCFFSITTGTYFCASSAAASEVAAAAGMAASMRMQARPSITTASRRSARIR